MVNDFKKRKVVVEARRLRSEKLREEVAHMLQVLWTVRKSWKESVTSRE